MRSVFKDTGSSIPPSSEKGLGKKPDFSSPSWSPGGGWKGESDARPSSGEKQGGPEGPKKGPVGSTGRMKTTTFG